MNSMITRLLATAALSAALLMAPVAGAQATPDQISAAIADTARPATDTERDVRRHPAELLAFTQVKPGDTVIDVIPGGGYFTRLFSNVVGADGKVVAFVPKVEVDKYGMEKGAKAAAEGRANVSVVIDPIGGPYSTGNADVVFTSQNYHDLHTDFIPGGTVAAFNKAVFAALKPGGVFIVIDHSAKPGADISVADTLHRIDPAIVKAEVEAAGFVFDGESPVLANPADTREASVFDEAIRGKTDQFAYRFRKPAN